MYTHVNVKLLKGKKKKVCLFGFKKMIYHQIFILLIFYHILRRLERGRKGGRGREERGRLKNRKKDRGREGRKERRKKGRD
jgi:hypothetical protein